MQFNLVKSLLATAFITVSATSYAGLYKCVDASGRASFQEKECPRSSSSSEIKVRGASPHHPAIQKANIANKEAHGNEASDGNTVAQRVEINKASKAELQAVVGEQVAVQILAERSKGTFTGWPDVVRRVVGLSAAQTAVTASISGLTVNGNSLAGCGNTQRAQLRC